LSTFLKSSVPALDRALSPPLPNAERSHQPNPVSAGQRANHFDENASLSASGGDLTPTRKSNRDGLESTLFCLRSTNSSRHIGQVERHGQSPVFGESPTLGICLGVALILTSVLIVVMVEQGRVRLGPPGRAPGLGR
jgi:hypothetical protein